MTEEKGREERATSSEADTRTAKLGTPSTEPACLSDSFTPKNKWPRLKTSLRSRSLAVPGIPIARQRRDILSRKDHVFKLNEEQIFAATQYHVSYTYTGTTLKGLDKYHDCVPYGISENSEQHLLRLEVKRLIDQARPNEPFLFDSGGTLTSTTDEAYQDIANVADQIRCNLYVIRLDAARVSLAHYDGMVSTTIGAFRRTRRRLVERFDDAHAQVQGAEPKLLADKERNKRLYFALVDYITSSIARLVVRTVSSAYWNRHFFAALAAYAVKLKALSYDPRRFANLCTGTAEHAIEEMAQKFLSKQAMFIKVRLKPDANMEDVDTLDTETDASGRYHAEITHFSQYVHDLVRNVLTSLLIPREQSSSSASSFESCALIYNAGLDGALTTLSSDREGVITAASNPFRLKTSYVALELLSANIKRVKIGMESSPPSRGSPQGKYARIQYERASTRSNQPPTSELLWTANISYVFSVMMPLALATTSVTAVLDNAVQLATSATDDENPILQFESPPKDLRMLATISSANWIAKEEALDRGVYKDTETLTLTKSPFKHPIRAGTNISRYYNEESAVKGAEVHNKRIKAEERYYLDKYCMDQWVICEDSVIIQVRFYVRAIITIGLMTVCGGMAIPFLVGQRIAGVDPFQLTTFAWVVAGFIVVFAKSRYVAQWPWHDFLHGRVVCRSVGDVCDVTGISPQTVLMYLLVEEQTTPLRTKGPYNGMFSRKTEDSSGFSIDEAAHISTVLASGFIVLKVLDEAGEHLTCLDVRKGAKGQTPAIGETAEHLAFMNLDEEEQKFAPDTSTGQSQAPQSKLTGKLRNIQKVKKLSIVEFRVNRVLGVYVGDSRFG